MTTLQQKKEYCKKTRASNYDASLRLEGFESKEKSVDKKIVVVSAVWCAGCNALKKQLDANGIKYDTIDSDSDEGMEFCKANGVRTLPTSFIYEDSILVNTVVGNKYKEIVE